MLTVGVSAVVVLTIAAALVLAAAKTYSIEDFFRRCAWLPTIAFGLAYFFRVSLTHRLGYFAVVPVICLGILSVGFVALGFWLILRARRENKPAQSLVFMTAFTSLPAIVLIGSIAADVIRSMR